MSFPSENLYDTLPIGSEGTLGATDSPGEHADGRAKLLVVDDDELLGRALRRMLRSTYDVTLALSGAEAIEHLRGSSDFALLLCDMSMPGMGGIDLFRYLARAHPEAARRTVFMTGGALSPAVSEFMREQAHRTICKPFTCDVIASVIEAHLQAFDEEEA